MERSQHGTWRALSLSALNDPNAARSEPQVCANDPSQAVLHPLYQQDIVPEHVHYYAALDRPEGDPPERLTKVYKLDPTACSGTVLGRQPGRRMTSRTASATRTRREKDRSPRPVRAVHRPRLWRAIHVPQQTLHQSLACDLSLVFIHTALVCFGDLLAVLFQRIL